MTLHPSRWIVPAVAALSLQLTGCSDDSTKSPDSEGTTEPSSEGTTTAPAPEHDYVLLLDDDSDPDQMEGRAGTYALTARGAATAPLAVLDAPEGYSNFGFFALWPFGSDPATGEPTPGPFRAIQYWTVQGVFPEPCDRGSKEARRIGDSVQDLARALAAQDLTSASKPVPVSLDGHQGLYLELTVPSDVKIDDCDGGYYMFWDASEGEAQHTASAPGSVERTWMLDVDGERVVLVAITDPDATDAQADELTDMVESIRFVVPQ